MKQIESGRGHPCKNTTVLHTHGKRPNIKSPDCSGLFENASIIISSCRSITIKMQLVDHELERLHLATDLNLNDINAASQARYIECDLLFARNKLRCWDLKNYA